MMSRRRRLSSPGELERFTQQTRSVVESLAKESSR